MPRKCPIERAAYDKQYRLDNVEHLKEKYKQYYLDNVQHLKEKVKQYRIDNIEKVKKQKKQYQLDNIEKIKQYNQSDNGKKSFRISDWKRNGIITDDYEFLYEWYMGIDNCLNCGIELINGTGVSNHKHLDHDHTTGQPCIVVCGHCNLHILK